MKYLKIIVCFTFVSVILTGCAINKPATVFTQTDISNDDTQVVKDNIDPITYETNIQHRIILDTDTAGDDAAAIAMLAKAPNITIEGVTVLAGNVDLVQGTQNALMTLEMAGHPEIPVYTGVDTTIDGTERTCFSVFGEDGMGDQDLIHPSIQAQEDDAIEFILETVRNNPDEIEIVSIGPATNIAMAIQKDPETMKRVKRIWSMGTAGFGTGNATPVAEFNVYHDYIAYEVLVNAGIPMTVIGLDMCVIDDVAYDNAELDAVAKSCELGSFLAKAWQGLVEFKAKNTDASRTDICDAVAASAIIWDNFIEETINCSAYVCTEEDAACGQVIFYKENFVYDSMPEIENYDVQVVTKINASMYKKEFIDLIKKID